MKFNLKFKEIETKYNAENIDLKDFEAFCIKQKPDAVIIASGYDHFFEKDGDDGLGRNMASSFGCLTL